MSLTDAIRPLYDNILLPNIYNNSVTAKLVSTEYENRLKKDGGDTVHMNSMLDLTMKDYDGTDYEPETLNVIGQDLQIDQYKLIAFEIDDVTNKQTHLNLLPAARNSVRNQARVTIDTFLLGSQADVPSANTLGTVTTPKTLANTNIYDYTVDLYKYLEDTGALDGGEQPNLLVGTAQSSLYKKSTELIHATAAGDKVIRDGKIGNIAGFDVYSTRNLAAISSKYHLLAFVASAIQFAMQINKTKVADNPFNFGTIYAMLWAYGRKTVTFVDGTSTTQTKVVKMIAN